MYRGSSSKSNWKKKLKKEYRRSSPESSTNVHVFCHSATDKHIVKNHPGIDRSDLGLGWSAELVSLSVRRISRRIVRRTAII